MAKILITGATGNIGRAIIQHFNYSDAHQVYAAVRDPARESFSKPVQTIAFDFADRVQIRAALAGMDVLFLLRPPQIADVDNIFRPLIQIARECGIQHIVFLSVQGAEDMSFIPHSKIEKLIIEAKIPYTFIRPGYFMQNLTTTLREELIHKHKIYLPAGRTPFNWTDADDVGLVCARVLENPALHNNVAYTITGTEQLPFNTVADSISQATGIKINYESPSPISFFINRKRQSISTSYILVMLLLHYLPRFSKPAPLTDTFQQITGRQPNTLQQFIQEQVKPLLQVTE